MTLVLSQSHQDAVLEALRVNALHARLALLTTPATAPTIAFYADPIPNPWDSGIPNPAPTPVVTLTMAAGVGAVDEALFQIQFVVPVEAQIAGADPTTGTTVTWAAIYDGDGVLWGYGSVSDSVGDGDFKLQETLLLQGAYARLTSATIQG